MPALYFTFYFELFFCFRNNEESEEEFNDPDLIANLKSNHVSGRREFSVTGGIVRFAVYAIHDAIHQVESNFLNELPIIKY